MQITDKRVKEMNNQKGKIEKEKLCGWESGDCNECPYLETKNNKYHCGFDKEFKKLLKWFWDYILQLQDNFYGFRQNGLKPMGRIRFYYGKKEVIEWIIDDLPYEYKQQLFELWRGGGKKAFKKLGFGMILYNDRWIFFWEVKLVDKLLKYLELDWEIEQKREIIVS